MTDSTLGPVVGHDADGRALFRPAGVTTYRDRALTRDRAEDALALRDAFATGGAQLLTVNRGRAQRSSGGSSDFFTAHALLWDGRAVRMLGVTPVLVAAGWVGRRRGSDTDAAYRGMARLEPGIVGLVALMLQLEADAIEVGRFSL